MCDLQLITCYGWFVQLTCLPEYVSSHLPGFNNSYFICMLHTVDWLAVFASHKLNSIRYTHPFNGRLSGTTRVSRYQKGKTNLDFTEARDSEWQWHQLGHMQVCISFQADNRASTPPLSFFTGRMPFLPPNQQRQSTEGNSIR